VDDLGSVAGRFRMPSTFPVSGSFSDAVVAGEVGVGDVALAVLHREGVRLGEAVVQEQLLHPGMWMCTASQTRRFFSSALKPW